MAYAKFFVNCVERDLLKSKVTREGSRAIDLGRFDVPTTTPVCASDTITYVQDMVCLSDNRLLFNFCQHVKDESGYRHHSIGHTDFPAPLSFWDFQCVTTDCGSLQNTATEVCGASVYAAGKVRCSGTTDRAISFACMRHLTISCECDYDFNQDQKFSLATWVFPTNSSDGILIAKRAALCCSAGYSLHRTSTTVSFQLGESMCKFTVATPVCSVPICMWTHVAAVNDASSNRSGMKIYINGELCVTGASLVINGPIVNNVVLSLGAESDGGNPFTGRLDGTYFFDKELSADEVKALYYEGALEYICGLWDGKAVEFDGCTGHTVVEDTTPACPRPDNIKLQLKFECNITDSSVTANTVIMARGFQTYMCGLIDNKAFEFEGGSCGRYLSVCCASNFDFDFTCEHSFSWWQKIPANASSQTVYMKGCTGDNPRTELEICATCGVLKTTWQSGTCNSLIISSTTTSLDDDDWHHIAVTKSTVGRSDSVSIYIDGVKDCLTVVSDDLCCNTITSGKKPRIGANEDGCNTLTGKLDCLRIWDKELTSLEVERLYNSTYGKIRNKYCIVVWVKALGSPCCDRTIFHKSTGSTDGVQLSIEQSNAIGPGFTCTGYTTSGFVTAIGCGGCSFATWRHGSTSITGNVNVADNCWHQIRVKRNGCNLVTMYVDNVLQTCCSTITCDPTSTANLEFARDPAPFMCKFFDGSLSSFRWYAGNLSSDETTKLQCCRNPRSNIKFGGDVTKVTKLIEKKQLVTQSFGKELGEIEVRAEQFCCRTPEYILKTLIKTNTSLDTHIHGVPSSVTLQSYQACGKIVDIANDLSQLTGKVYRTDGLRQFHLHDSSFTITTASFDHSVNMRNFETGEDDAEIVNDLVIIGENKRFTTSCTFDKCTPAPNTVDGTNTVFTLTQKPVTARIFSPSCMCTEVCPEVNYNISSVTRQVTFTSTSIPAMCTTVLVEYEYELPLNIRATNDDSIAEFGVKAKRLILPWITTKNDGVRFIKAYLENFKTIKFRTQADIPGLANGLNENDVISIKNDVKGIPATSFIIKSIAWEYPAGRTILELGEFNFQMLEFAKQITEKIHDLEAAVIQTKDLRDFESAGEILPLTITATASESLSFTECPTLTDTVAFTEVFNATYDCPCTAYDGDEAYT